MEQETIKRLKEIKQEFIIKAEHTTSNSKRKTFYELVKSCDKALLAIEKDNKWKHHKDYLNVQLKNVEKLF